MEVHTPAPAWPQWEQFVTPAVLPAGGPVRINATTFGHFPHAQGGEFDLFFADPPYNFGLDYGAGAKADKLSRQDYRTFTHDWIDAACWSLRPGGSMWVLVPDEVVTDVTYRMGSHIDHADNFERRNWIKWVESFGVQTSHKFARLSRHLLYYVKRAKGRRGKGMTFNADAVKVPSDRQTKYADRRAADGGKVMGDVWEFSRVAGTFSERAKGFQNQIPEALLERVVKTCTNPGDRVLEFFTGSGSLARVCLAEGRAYDGYESVARNARNAHARVQERAAELRKTGRGLTLRK